MSLNPFDEDNYLDGNPLCIRYFEESYRDNTKKWEKEKTEFASVLYNYDQLVEIVANFIRNLGYKNAIDCSMIISYLVNNGFLSNEMNMESKSPNPDEEISSSLGTSIIRGEGCCRNYTQIHQDIFNKLGESLNKLYCYQGNNAFNKARKSPANHVIGLIEHEDNLYGIDLYNGDRLYCFKNGLVLKEISITDSCVLRYKPYYDIAAAGLTLDEVNEKIKRFKTYSEKRSINPFDFQDDIRFRIKRRLRRKEDSMYELHEKTKVLKKDIVEEMNRAFSKHR